jgi:16S rRNA (cytosine1402-N4)-methyltransferase
MKDNAVAARPYHVPVLTDDIVRILTVKKNAVILDGTLGGGGHAEALLHSLGPEALYIGVDRDEEAIEYSRQRLKGYSNIVFYHGSFNNVEEAIREAEVTYVDGILLDLGVSSHQIDADERGFAFRRGLDLDMRMNRGESKTAADILNTYTESELFRVFSEYGEERYSRRIARGVVRSRENRKISKSDALMDIIRGCIAPAHLVKSYARIFQALRIEVNQELDILKMALKTGLDYLSNEGRLAVITYHSLEDRLVKQFIRGQEKPCTCPPDLPYCVCGKTPRMKRFKPEVISPDQEEVAQNPRARSAKLRVGEKI